MDQVAEPLTTEKVRHHFDLMMPLACSRWSLLIAALLVLMPLAARATDNYEYGKNEYVTISKGISPDRKLAITAHGEGEMGYGKFHLYLFDAVAGRKLGPLEEIVEPLDTGAGSYAAKWSKDSAEVTIVYRVDRHAPMKAMTYRLTQGHAVPSSRQPLDVHDESLQKFWSDQCAHDRPTERTFGTPKNPE